ncbi:uncharacterized protein [Antedon mediterranea]|uniref:uncharacterized protein n=1 Tax=Antedon mediterranea TaxID=105859 RepID=UPI003AF42F12
MSSGTNVRTESRSYRIETQQRFTSNQRSSNGIDHGTSSVTSTGFNGSSTNVPSIRVSSDSKTHQFRPVSPLSSNFNSRSQNDDDRNTAVIKSSDMTEEMQETAVELALDAFKRCKVEKDIAANIKQACDEKLGPTWHCIVGKSFGSYVTHETDYSIYLYVGQMAILLFKQG